MSATGVRFPAQNAHFLHAKLTRMWRILHPQTYIGKTNTQEQANGVLVLRVNASWVCVLLVRFMWRGHFSSDLS